MLLTKQTEWLHWWTECAARAKGWSIEDIWPDWSWLGVSVTNQQDANERVPWLLKTPAAHRWVSIEPIHGPVDLSRWLAIRPVTYPAQWERVTGGHNLLDWVAIGSETGNRADKVIPQREWVQAIVEQCRAAGVPVFMKANLAPVVGYPLVHEYPEGWKGGSR